MKRYIILILIFVLCMTSFAFADFKDFVPEQLSSYSYTVCLLNKGTNTYSWHGSNSPFYVVTGISSGHISLDTDSYFYMLNEGSSTVDEFGVSTYLGDVDEEAYRSIYSSSHDIFFKDTDNVFFSPMTVVGLVEQGTQGILEMVAIVVGVGLTSVLLVIGLTRLVRKSLMVFRRLLAR
ncbi:hypothetical protein QBE52_18965 [Clostridiaceae bacterium 35-E11]